MPDYVFKTKNSIACILSVSDIEKYLPFFQQSNQDFIRAAVHTSMTSTMRRTHSEGAVTYILANTPPKQGSDLPSFEAYLQGEEQQVQVSKALSQAERLQRLQMAAKLPAQQFVQQRVFIRNPDVVAAVLFRAGGYCEHCRQPAPFLRASDHSPYLEVHHKKPLAEGGEDTMDNAIALCPNCHREAHYG
jgi:5-methylcytosine-specific restriction enzyme A